MGTGNELIRLAAWPNSDAAAANFKAALSNYGVETFESFADDTPMSGQTLNFGGVGATFNGPAAMTVQERTTGTNGLGRYPTDGNKYLEGSTFEFRIEFNRDITAFGFYGIDIGDWMGQATIATLPEWYPDFEHRCSHNGTCRIWFSFVPWTDNG